MRISDWSSDVCSSDLDQVDCQHLGTELAELHRTLLRNDDADQETHEADDAQGRNTDHFEALHHRVDPKAPGVTHDIPCRDQRSAKEAKQSAQRLAGRDGGLSNFAEHSAERWDLGAAH